MDEIPLQPEILPLKRKKVRSVPPKRPDGDPSMDSLLPGARGSTFLLMRLAMVRAHEIHAGGKPLVDHLPTDKEATIAFREIAQGKVALKDNNHPIPQ